MKFRLHRLFLAVGSFLLAAAVISCAPAAPEDGSEPVGGRDMSSMTKDTGDPSPSPEVAATDVDRKTSGRYDEAPPLMKYFMGTVLPEIATKDPSALEYAERTQCQVGDPQCCVRFFDVNDGLLDWMSRRRLDTSAERSCPNLYHVWGRSGEKQYLTTICRRNSGFSVLSSFREGDMEGLSLECWKREGISERSQ